MKYALLLLPILLAACTEADVETVNIPTTPVVQEYVVDAAPQGIDEIIIQSDLTVIPPEPVITYEPVEITMEPEQLVEEIARSDPTEVDVVPALIQYLVTDSLSYWLCTFDYAYSASEYMDLEFSIDGSGLSTSPLLSFNFAWSVTNNDILNIEANSQSFTLYEFRYYYESFKARSVTSEEVSCSRVRL